MKQSLFLAFVVAILLISPTQSNAAKPIGVDQIIQETSFETYFNPKINKDSTLYSVHLAACKTTLQEKKLPFEKTFKRLIADVWNGKAISKKTHPSCEYVVLGTLYDIVSKVKSEMTEDSPRFEISRHCQSAILDGARDGKNACEGQQEFQGCKLPQNENMDLAELFVRNFGSQYQFIEQNNEPNARFCKTVGYVQETYACQKHAGQKRERQSILQSEETLLVSRAYTKIISNQMSKKGVFGLTPLDYINAAPEALRAIEHNHSE